MSSSSNALVSRIGAGGVLASLLAAACMLGSSLSVFMDLPSTLLVIGGGGLAWWMTSGQALWQLPATLRADAPTSGQLALAGLTAGQGRRAMWLVGITGFLIGCIQMLQALDDPSAVGPAVAVAFLTLFYPLLLEVFFFMPLRSAIEHKVAQGEQQAQGTQAIERELAASLAALKKLKQGQKSSR